MSDSAFLGTGWAFPIRFDRTGVAMSSAEQDIEESLRILLSTQPGERMMNPHYGCDLRASAFQSLNNSTRIQLQDRITRAILFFEPRVHVESVEIMFPDAIEGKAQVEVAYVVNSTNTRYNLVFPYYLTEATDTAL